MVTTIPKESVILSMKLQLLIVAQFRLPHYQPVYPLDGSGSIGSS